MGSILIVAVTVGFVVRALHGWVTKPEDPRLGRLGEPLYKLHGPRPPATRWEADDYWPFEAPHKDQG